MCAGRTENLGILLAELALLQGVKRDGELDGELLGKDETTAELSIVRAKQSERLTAHLEAGLLSRVSDDDFSLYNGVLAEGLKGK